jgi:hypothetical protein
MVYPPGMPQPPSPWENKVQVPEQQELMMQRPEYTTPPAPVPVARPMPPQTLAQAQVQEKEEFNQQQIQELMNRSMPAPEVRVVRRNLTVAELIVVFVIAMVGVTGIQFVFNAIPKPQIEINWSK